MQFHALWAALGLLAFSFAGAAVEVISPPREIAGHRTIAGAQLSARTNPIPVRYVYGPERDWRQRPFRAAVVLIEFPDKKHETAHSAALYEKLLFSRDEYHRQPDGNPSFGSMADWYRVQSQGRFVLTGKVFDWVTIGEKFETIHAMKLRAAQTPLFKVAMEKVRARDGTNAFSGFDALIFIHAGPIIGPTTNILWSHQDKVEGTRYFTTGEIERIGVFCHEWGHVIGLPDLYGKAGVRESFGPWCAMAAGYRGKYPKSFCAWSKARLGWCQPAVVDASTPQKLVLRPIQSYPNDAFLIPLDASDGVGADFLLLENRAATGNDEEGQAGLFIWRIHRQPDSGGFQKFELRLPGPADQPGMDQTKRRVAWPFEGAHDFVVKSEGNGSTVVLRNIRVNNGLAYFELGAE